MKWIYCTSTVALYALIITLSSDLQKVWRIVSMWIQAELEFEAEIVFYC